jgi:hypothetical protein
MEDPYFDPRINEWIGSVMGASDCMLIGRVQYVAGETAGVRS